MYDLIIETKEGVFISKTHIPFGITQENYNTLFKYALNGHSVNDINITIKT